VTVLVDVRDQVATITLNQPERRNPLSTPMVRDMLRALAAAREDDEVRAVVLTGAGDRAFCAGADLTAFRTPGSELDRHAERGLLADLFLACEGLGKPLVGCINGHALAGGFGLALSCDLLVAAATATFGTPEINVGLWPMMVMAVVVRNLGRKRAMELFMTGECIDATRAEQWGFVNRVVPSESVRAEAHDLARSLTSKSPLILRLGREAFYDLDGGSLAASLRQLQSQLTTVALSDDTAEGIAAFFAKREPKFLGH
jgi:enoyl-CoA hydratase/carnithine racemase